MRVRFLLRCHTRIGRQRFQEPIERGVARIRPAQVQSRMERIGNQEFDDAERGARKQRRALPARLQLAYGEGKCG